MLSTRFSLSNLYLFVVCGIYAGIGFLGVVGTFPAGPYFISLFLTSDPYPLLHALTSLVGTSSSALTDAAPSFNLSAPQVREFVRNSWIVLLLAVVGAFAVISPARWGKTVLFVLISLSSLAAIWNWIAYLILISNIGPIFQGWVLVPIISTVWCLTYWFAFRARQRPSSTGVHLLELKFK